MPPPTRWSSTPSHAIYQPDHDPQLAYLPSPACRIPPPSAPPHTQESQPIDTVQGIEGLSASALLTMNHLIPGSHDAEIAKKAMRLIVAEQCLLEKEQAILCVYYAKNIPEAASLLVMRDSLRIAVFRKVLEGLTKIHMPL